MFRNSS